ncbi:PaiB family negative transcriptional regulator [Streptomyces puniciscabiei]|uniref:PaiB family negative transcriptional regulator n=1 Tax=Streptomyces puniciscabiei TaxID=164348 RepID=A0A542SZI9_9ACTN|nr:FMN-binding negative transcriptional regulator [Streptomyces puniciscabiei]TQK79952.1 PaiB family negative transcriptional regulator [Streptomyces puniciscabiei]
MLVHPWDAGLDEAEWQTWIAGGHDFGQLSVNGLPGHAHGRPHPLLPRRQPPPGTLGQTHPGIPPTDGVPTSYYAAVRFTCRAEIVDDPEAKAEPLCRRLAHFQPGGDHARVAADRPPYGRMLSAIRGLCLEVTDVQAKFKYDDHKPVEHRAGVADRLTERGEGLDVPTAGRQLRRLGRIGPWKP